MQNEISIVLAVLNEAKNVQTYLEQLDQMIEQNSIDNILEVIFVDDGSTDGTQLIIQKNMKIERKYQIRLISRESKKGLVNAHIAGIQHATSSHVIIMDCDLQHPVYLLPALFDDSREVTELVVYSRHTPGGGNVWSPIRGIISRSAIFISHFFIPNSRKIKDPMSGFFRVKRDLVADLIPYDGTTKLLLYLLASRKISKYEELPYTMIERKDGESKIVNGNLTFVLRFVRELIRYRKTIINNSNQKNYLNSEPIEY